MLSTSLTSTTIRKHTVFTEVSKLTVSKTFKIYYSKSRLQSMSTVLPRFFVEKFVSYPHPRSCRKLPAAILCSLVVNTWVLPWKKVLQCSLEHFMSIYVVESHSCSTHQNKKKYQCGLF